MPFETTTWHMATLATEHGQRSRDALTRLCAAYWAPVVAYLRQSGYEPEGAAAFARRFLTSLARTNPRERRNNESATFRTFLLDALKEVSANPDGAPPFSEYDAGVVVIPLGEVITIHSHDSIVGSHLTPEKAFDKAWAATVVRNALQRLGDESDRRGQLERFDALRPFISADDTRIPADLLAQELQLAEPAVWGALERLRNTLKVFIRREVEETLDDAADVESELRHLLAALSL